MTFPKVCGTLSELLLEVLKLTPPPRVCIICREKHADGTKHLHYYLEFNKKLDIKNPRYFDTLIPIEIDGKAHHGNISTVRNVGATLQYITKDGDYELYGITETELKIIVQGLNYKLADVVARIIHDPSIDEIALEFPQKYVLHHNGLTKLCNIVRKRNATHIVPYKWPTGIGNDIALLHEHAPQKIFIRLMKWLHDNFGDLSVLKPRKSTQLFICGPTGIGKTRLLCWLNAHWRGFLISSNEKFYDGYNDDDYDFIYIDEFHGNKKIQWMNTLLAGENQVIAIKSSQYQKRRNLPVIILSNLSPDECYPNVIRYKRRVYDAFLARLTVINFNEEEDQSDELHNFIDSLENDNDTGHLVPLQPPPEKSGGKAGGQFYDFNLE